MRQAEVAKKQAQLLKEIDFLLNKISENKKEENKSS